MQVPRTIARFAMALWVTGVASNALAQNAPLAGVRQIIAHRGSSADRPENTLASIRRAIEAEATAVEVDIRTTKDGKLVILHDATLDRTTNGTGPVEEKTFAEVQKLDAGSWFDPKYRQEHVPTLREVLAQTGNKIDVLLDLKGQGAEYARSVAAEVKAHGSPKRTLVGVRSVEQARLFRKLLPKAKQLGLIPHPDAIEAFAKEKVDTIRLWPRWLAKETELVQRVREAGAKLHLNGTTGEPDDILPLLKHQPDSLSSDDPARLVQTLADVQSDRNATSRRAKKWNIDPHKIGIVGYTAGADLAMNLAANFDMGDANAADPIERQSNLGKLEIETISRQMVRNILKEEGVEPERKNDCWNNVIERHAKMFWAVDFFSVKTVTTREGQEIQSCTISR